MLIIPLLLLAGLVGLLLGAFLQRKLSQKTVAQRRRNDVYLLPERRER
jgi:uncharacterized protein YneF (UPF0154 family)